MENTKIWYQTRMPNLPIVLIMTVMFHDLHEKENLREELEEDKEQEENPGDHRDARGMGSSCRDAHRGNSYPSSFPNPLV